MKLDDERFMQLALAEADKAREIGEVPIGAVVVEEVFARPGLGRSLLGAVLSRDMPMVTGIALFSALIYMVVMLIVETIEAIINPAAARGEDQ